MLIVLLGGGGHGAPRGHVTYLTADGPGLELFHQGSWKRVPVMPGGQIRSGPAGSPSRLGYKCLLRFPVQVAGGDLQLSKAHQLCVLCCFIGLDEPALK